MGINFRTVIRFRSETKYFRPNLELCDTISQAHFVLGGTVFNLMKLSIQLSSIVLSSMILLGAATAFAAEEGGSAPKDEKKISCKSGKTERVIEIKAGDGGGCTVTYTKDGQAKEVGQAAHHADVCTKIADKIQGKLRDAGFQCE